MTERDRIAGTRVAVILSGGNADTDLLVDVLSESLARSEDSAHSTVSRCGEGASGVPAAPRPDHPRALRTGAEAVTEDRRAGANRQRAI